MTDEGKKLLAQALMLAPKERAEIAAKLVDSVNTIAAAEAAWVAEIEVRARRAMEKELCPVYYLGRAPVPLRFDGDAELDLERAVGRMAEMPERVEDLLTELTDAIRRIAEAPCSFGIHTALPEELGVRRVYLRELPFTVLFVPMAKELRVLAVADKFHPPTDAEITIESLIAVEDWLATTGLRVATFIALGAVHALH